VRLPRDLLTVVVLASGACKASSDTESRDLQRVPTRGPVANPPPRHVLSEPQHDAAGRPCIGLDPAGTAVRGRLRMEVHLGPPGYGETPKSDERDTIVVLVLPNPLRVCADTASAIRGTSDSGSSEVDRFQLAGVPKSIWSNVGDSVTVYGALRGREWGWHFTPVILWADSIPDLRITPSAPRQAASE
jgi:hypothetical protein